MRHTILLALPAAAALGACDSGGSSPRACPQTPGTICPYMGTGHPGFNGDGRPLAESTLYWPTDLTFTSTGVYLLDWNNHRVRRVTDEGTFETVFGTDMVGDGDPDQGDLVKPGVDATTIDLNHPTQVLEMPDGKLLVDCWHNHKLRIFDPTTGLAYVWFGRGAGFKGDGEAAEAALLNQPAAVRYDKDMNLFILDQRNQRIRKIDTAGKITTVAGTGTLGFAGDDGNPLEAQVSFPPGSNPPPNGMLDFDADGRLYFADTKNNRIRRIDFTANTIETVLGDGTPAALNNPRDVERGPDGRIYVADEGNNRILALTPADLSVEIIAGTGTVGDSGDFGPAKDAQLNHPTGVAFDAAGDLYIADNQNNRVRIVRMGGK